MSYTDSIKQKCKAQDNFTVLFPIENEQFKANALRLWNHELTRIPYHPDFLSYYEYKKGVTLLDGQKAWFYQNDELNAVEYAVYTWSNQNLITSRYNELNRSLTFIFN